MRMPGVSQPAQGRRRSYKWTYREQRIGRLAIVAEVVVVEAVEEALAVDAIAIVACH